MYRGADVASDCNPSNFERKLNHAHTLNDPRRLQLDRTDDQRPQGRARLLAPMDIPTVGRFATIMDPQGATISLITYAKRN